MGPIDGRPLVLEHWRSTRCGSRNRHYRYPLCDVKDQHSVSFEIEGPNHKVQGPVLTVILHACRKVAAAGYPRQLATGIFSCLGQLVARRLSKVDREWLQPLTTALVVALGCQAHGSLKGCQVPVACKLWPAGCGLNMALKLQCRVGRARKVDTACVWPSKTGVKHVCKHFNGYGASAINTRGQRQVDYLLSPANGQLSTLPHEQSTTCMELAEHSVQLVHEETSMQASTSDANSAAAQDGDPLAVMSW